MKTQAFNFFVALEFKKYIYVDDVMISTDSEDLGYVDTLDFLLERGNDHCSKVFDKIEDALDQDRASREELLQEINARTKANIIHSILGLG
eukprot:10859627-Heterocapsa_arctica.AAC.1